MTNVAMFRGRNSVGHYRKRSLLEGVSVEEHGGKRGRASSHSASRGRGQEARSSAPISAGKK
jgi:hypothetical protein